VKKKEPLGKRRASDVGINGELLKKSITLRKESYDEADTPLTT